MRKKKMLKINYYPKFEIFFVFESLKLCSKYNKKNDNPFFINILNKSLQLYLSNKKIC